MSVTLRSLPSQAAGRSSAGIGFLSLPTLKLYRDGTLPEMRSVPTRPAMSSFGIVLSLSMSPVFKIITRLVSCPQPVNGNDLAQRAQVDGFLGADDGTIAQLVALNDDVLTLVVWRWPVACFRSGMQAGVGFILRLGLLYTFRFDCYRREVRSTTVCFRVIGRTSRVSDNCRYH
ncbi:hypothetical protein CGRA01v4_08100 [Colletotrichum graminicola]|nr:hypothetical protein CGRA01v4_08100 [Colletotrichum graminicola]